MYVTVVNHFHSGVILLCISGHIPVKDLTSVGFVRRHSTTMVILRNISKCTEYYISSLILAVEWNGEWRTIDNTKKRSGKKKFKDSDMQMRAIHWLPFLLKGHLFLSF
jgi:hypothetical protein